MVVGRGVSGIEDETGALVGEVRSVDFVGGILGGLGFCLATEAQGEPRAYPTS